MWTNELHRAIDETAAYATEIRRKLHRCPEIGGQEFRTAKIIEEELRRMGLSPKRLLSTGIVADLFPCGGERSEKTTALRADLDALPIEEESKLEFSSQNTGYMHACGHDVHSAILLGIAMLFTENKNIFNHNVKLIFQPNEEGEGGAREMIVHGVLEGVSEIFGLHAAPEFPAGTMGLRYGRMHAESVMFDLFVTGKKSHGAAPHRGKDAIAGAAQIISAAQMILSREISPTSAGLISFGKITGGEARNVLAERVCLEGIIRGEGHDVCTFLQQRLTNLSEGVGRALGLGINFRFQEGYPALVNDDGAVNRVRAAMKAYNEGCEKGDSRRIRTREIEETTMAVDDFAYFLQKVPGAYLLLGSGYPDRENSGLHTSTFEVNEDCIRTGIATLAACVCRGKSE